MNRLLIVGIFLAPFALLASCKDTLPPEPGIVVFPVEAGFELDATSLVPPDCRAACDNLELLHCPESLPEGRTCGAVCASALKSGRIDLHLFCVANARTVAAVRACHTVRCCASPGCS